MKKSVVAFSLMLASAAAFALPTPKDIEGAVNAGNLVQAETMLHEVIAAKPGSAKAHYELGQVLAREGKLEAAGQQLAQAEALDPSLKFASDPLQFRNLVNKVSTAAHAPAAAPARVASAPSRPAAETGMPWGMLLIGGGVLIIGWLVIRRMSAASQAQRYAPASTTGLAAAGGTMNSGGFGNYGGVPPASTGSGIGGAVLGGVAGLAAGYGLAKMLENNDGHRPAAADNGLAPIESPPADFGSFDAGTGSDWDSGADSSGGDGGGDSW